MKPGTQNIQLNVFFLASLLEMKGARTHAVHTLVHPALAVTRHDEGADAAVAQIAHVACDVVAHVRIDGANADSRATRAWPHD